MFVYQEWCSTLARVKNVLINAEQTGQLSTRTGLLIVQTHKPRLLNSLETAVILWPAPACGGLPLKCKVSLQPLEATAHNFSVDKFEQPFPS